MRKIVSNKESNKDNIFDSDLVNNFLENDKKIKNTNNKKKKKFKKIYNFIVFVKKPKIKRFLFDIIKIFKN